MSFRSFISQQMQRASIALNNAAFRIYTRDRAAKPSGTVLDEYVAGMPTAQNAVDILPGWKHPVAPQTSAPAGSQPAYNDPRILWAIEQYGSLEGRKILELVPGTHCKGRFSAKTQFLAFLPRLESIRSIFAAR